MSQPIFASFLYRKFRIFIMIALIINFSFAYFSGSDTITNFTFSNKAVASSESFENNPDKYLVYANKYIEWIPNSNNSETIEGYRIWLKTLEETENLFTLIEHTYLRSNVPLSYVTEKSRNQQIHHIGPLMLFIEIWQTPEYEFNAENNKNSYFDLVANEVLPDFLFKELLEYSPSSTDKKEPVAFPWLSDSNTYIFQTDNYFAYFLVEYVSDALVEQNELINNKLLKIIDPIEPGQYSHVYVP